MLSHSNPWKRNASQSRLMTIQQVCWDFTAKMSPKAKASVTAEGRVTIPPIDHVLATWPRGYHFGQLLSMHDYYLGVWGLKPAWALFTLPHYGIVGRILTGVHGFILNCAWGLACAKRGAVYGPFAMPPIDHVPWLLDKGLISLWSTGQCCLLPGSLGLGAHLDLLHFATQVHGTNISLLLFRMAVFKCNWSAQTYTEETNFDLFYWLSNKRFGNKHMQSAGLFVWRCKSLMTEILFWTKNCSLYMSSLGHCPTMLLQTISEFKLASFTFASIVHSYDT